MMTLTQAELAGRMEVSVWRADATAQDIEQVCARARDQKLRAVCIAGSRLELTSSLLQESDVKVIGLIGFPFGSADSDVKRYEAEAAIDCGAQEIEMVLNIGGLKDGDRKGVLRELRDVAEAADERPVTVILESGLLTPAELALACELALDSGVHAVSTGTGLNGPPTVDEVKLLVESVGAKFGVKAIADLRDAGGLLTLIRAGATRLGVAH
jgi:deoxyribose-phosphate aldolase